MSGSERDSTHRGPRVRFMISRHLTNAFWDLVLLVVLGGGLILGASVVPGWEWPQHVKDHANHLVTLAGFTGAAYTAWVQLERARRASRVEYDHRLRIEFITGSAHRQFQTIIATLEAPKSPQGKQLRAELAKRASTEVSEEVESVLEPQIVRSFDAYANYLEAVAQLHHDGIFGKNDVAKGWWGYYMKAMDYSPEVAKYVTLPRHDWTGLTRVLKAIRKRDRRRRFWERLRGGLGAAVSRQGT